MRFKCFLLVTGLALLLGPAVAMSQFGGGRQGGFGGPPGGFGQGRGFGGRGGGFGSMDPNDRWNQYTGGKAVWKRSEITDPSMLQRFDRTAQRLGVTNGQITKEQYVGMMQQFTQRFMQQGTTGRGGAMPAGGAAQPAAAGSSPQATFAGPQAGGWNQQGAWNQQGGRGRRQRGNFGQGPGGGGFNMDAIAEYRFRQLDTNGDGLLNYDEMAQDEALQSERQKWDTNGDGNIDLNEFKEYMKARIQQFQAGRTGGQQGWNPLQMLEEDQDKKPVVYRAGKLPPNIPAWFRELDTDGDGQVGLYEWKAAGRPIPEFETYDLNGDGFLTVEEVMKNPAIAKGGNTASPGSTVASAAPNPGNTPGTFGPGQGRFGGRGNRGFGVFGGFGGGQGAPGADQGGGRRGRGNRGFGGFGGFGGGQGAPGADQGGGRRGRGNRGFGGFGGGQGFGGGFGGGRPGGNNG